MWRFAADRRRVVYLGGFVVALLAGMMPAAGVEATENNCIDDWLDYCWPSTALCGDCEAACEVMGDCQVQFNFCEPDGECDEQNPVHNVCTCEPAS